MSDVGGASAPGSAVTTVLTPVDLRGVPRSDLARALPRPREAEDPSVEAVRSILEEVRRGGDAAVRMLTETFDRAVVDDLRVDPTEVASAPSRIAPELDAALRDAAGRIEDFQRHRCAVLGITSGSGNQVGQPVVDVFEKDGISVGTRRRAVDRAGLYVPGGRAKYPSTVLMTAIPARVAGVGDVALCVPPGPDGNPPVETLAAAAVAGVDEVYRIGGAQAIAAMAYGTESVKSVDVIAGPGNYFVSVAKQLVSGVVGVPGAFAGPSEVVVVADASTPANLVAVDLAVQAEHGPDGLAWLVTWVPEVVVAVEAALARVVTDSPRRGDLESTLASGGYVALVDGPEQAVEVVNLIAPEHLELLVENPAILVDRVRHAGVVFAGTLAPAPVGDYVAGPSHVLPTNGTARFGGALSVVDFTKEVSVVSVAESRFDEIAAVIATLAEAEGLDAHALSMRLRRAVP